MFTGPIEPQSNRSDLTITYSLTSVDDGLPFDVTGAAFVATIYDAQQNIVLTGSTADGSVTVPSAGIIQYYAPQAFVSALKAGKYEASLVATRDGLTEEIFRNSLTVTGDA